ncbi:MAG: hypothetical protein GY835_11265, partial [bacterium]|nr:hypothetical protein [bacterium]
MVLGEKTDTRSPGTHLRWLHLSDFHIETDPPWKGRPSLRALIRHLGELREQGLAPDLVFVTGDVARNGRDHFTVAGVDDLLVIPTPINESLTPGVSALRELTTIDDRSEAKPLLATALT